MSVTFHYDSLEDLAAHIERLGREKITNAKKAEDAGRQNTTKARILADTAEGKGMLEAADMIRTAKVKGQ